MQTWRAEYKTHGAASAEASSDSKSASKSSAAGVSYTERYLRFAVAFVVGAEDRVH